MNSTTLNPLIINYLKSLGWTTSVTATLTTLETLQTNHIQTFSHDTIDSCLKRPISLDPTKIIAKFLVENRGGLCFELNGAFCYLLQKLGFNATLVSSNVRHVEKRQFNFSIDTHAVILVTFDKNVYLVDVGFADSFRKPILLESTYNDFSGNYRVSKIEQDTYGLYKYVDEQWFLQYTFTTAPKKLIDFKSNLHFVCHSSQHDFSHSLICTRPTSTGHLVLLNIKDEKGDKKLLIIKNGKDKAVTHFVSFDDAKKILSKRFGMNPEMIKSLKEPEEELESLVASSFGRASNTAKELTKR